LPIYPYVKSLDNVNFSTKTIWNKSTDDEVFSFENRIGKQMIMEASDLRNIKCESYEFVVSSHVIEHLSNPIKSVMEMKRVLITNGFIILVAPHKEATFDRKRTVTSLKHLIDDYKDNIKEGDLSHLDLKEIISQYDFKLDPGVNGRDDFIKRTEQNMKNRALHQHVFITETIIQLLDYCNLEIVLAEPKLSYGIVIVARKLVTSNVHDIRKNNSSFLSDFSDWRRLSPYDMDRN
jgi:SAM-dependent methyltransferase